MIQISTQDRPVPMLFIRRQGPSRLPYDVIHTHAKGVAMRAERINELWAEFDDLASKSENEDVQFLIRAIKLHAELMNARLGALEVLGGVNVQTKPT
ncbi:MULTISPECIES: hypothetical protein [Burkholderia]|nr:MULTISPECIES: hypothetical protein [Burkholderia]KVR93143.1 hypothetical protein WK28_17535 [Burkholderia vietnamiensis]MCA8206665.1 hypothetical protein [Burkholderia vietnamiensis]MCO1347130.1 hypothetical protein [Burkholderia vietnamiensis]UQN49366.1 hypothetical protein L0Y95_25780 [Burkholderia vietnamiensis]